MYMLQSNKDLCNDMTGSESFGCGNTWYFLVLTAAQVIGL